MDYIEILSTNSYSVGFPEINKEELISRENYLSEIESALKEKTEIIFIEGESGAGKTTLLSDFAKKNKNIISVFFNPLNNLDNNVEFFCANMINQIRFLMGEEIDQNIDVNSNVESYKKCIFNLRRKQKKIKYSIIVDGLEDKITDNENFIKEIISLLPISTSEFNIIFTGPEQKIKNTLFKNKDIHTKSIKILGFSNPEVKDYLSQYNLSIKNISEIFKVTKGLPGRLKILKRILEK